jgi:hypothetical protein
MPDLRVLLHPALKCPERYTEDFGGGSLWTVLEHCLADVGYDVSSVVGESVPVSEALSDVDGVGVGWG